MKLGRASALPSVTFSDIELGGIVDTREGERKETRRPSGELVPFKLSQGAGMRIMKIAMTLNEALWTT
jgi:hypothetical protein